MNEDENVTPKRLAALEEGVGVLATEVVRQNEVQQAQGELLMNMDARLRALTGLIDHHHTVLTKIAGLPPRPKGDPLAN